MGAALFAVMCYGVFLGGKRQLDLVILAIGIPLLANTTFDLVTGEIQIGYNRTLAKDENPTNYWIRIGGWGFIAGGFVVMLLMQFFPKG